MHVEHRKTFPLIPSEHLRVKQCNPNYPSMTTRVEFSLFTHPFYLLLRSSLPEKTFLIPLYYVFDLDCDNAINDMDIV